MKKTLLRILMVSLPVIAVGCAGEAAPETQAPEPQPVETQQQTRQLSDLLGLWEFAREERHILFYEDLSWEMIGFEGENLGAGEFQFDGQELILAMDGKILTYCFDENGDQADEDEALLLTWVCGFESGEYQQFLEELKSRKWFFEEMGYEINYAFGDEWVFQKNGAFLILNNGEFYDRMGVIVRIDRDSYEDTGDGFAEILFSKTVYMDCEGQPEEIRNAKSYSAGVTNGLYDYSTEWEQHADGSVAVITKNWIRMPADYDGLIFAATEGYPDFATYALTISAEVDKDGDNIGQMKDSDVENAIFCRINPLNE